MKAHRKTIRMIGLLLLMAVASISFAQQNGIYGSIGQKPSPTYSDYGPVLWNQMDVPGSGFMACQEVTNSADEAETCIAADDFYVPEGATWEIGSIAFVGTFFDMGTGPVDTFNVIFYDDAPGLPGAEIVEHYNVVGFTYEEELVNGYTVVTYNLKLPEVLTLDGGHYWMSAQAKGSYTEMGKWGWNDYWAGSVPSEENQWHWKNPLDGYGLGYTDWTPAVEVVAIFLSYDLSFALYAPALENDLAVYELISPVSDEGLTAAEEVTIKIRNEGTMPQTGFDLKYVINGIEVVENIGDVIVNPNEFYEFTFTQTVDMEAAGPYEFSLSTMLTGDEYTDNDMLEKTIFSLGTVYIMENGNTSASVTTCSGTSVDMGGLDNNFEQTDFGTVTFYPETAGSQIRLTFIEFDIQWGDMELYDGPDISSPSFGIFNKGTGSPGVITAFNETGALTMRFEASGWDNGPGWVAFISCFDPSEDDFAVLDLSLSQNTVFAGEYVTATATIQNFGTLTQSKDVTFAVNGESFGVVNTGDLDAWETVEVEAEWNPASAGIYTLTASVPEDEGIDDNNSFSMEQEVLSNDFLFEDFENDTWPPAGWSLSTGMWERNEGTAMNGNAYAHYFTTPEYKDTLITPTLSILEGDELTFQAKGSWWWPGDLEVVYKESGTSTWTSVEFWDAFSISAAPALFTVDLGAYAGQNGQLGFVAHGNIAWWDLGEIYLDDVNGPLKLTYTANLAAHDFSGPLSPVANEPATYELVVKNLGTDAQAEGSYTVRLMTAGGDELAAVAGLEIQPLELIEYQLEYTFTETGEVVVYAEIDFADDQNMDDNMSSSLNVYVQQEGTQQVQIGTGIQETWNYPLGTSGAYKLSEMLYLNDEIGLSGIMTGISFFYYCDAVFPIEDYPVDIYLGETTDDALPVGTDWIPSTELTLVFSGILTMYPGDNMIYIPFDDTYTYGGDNLVVMTHDTDDAYHGNTMWYCHTTTLMQTKWASDYNVVPDPEDPSNLYPHDEYLRPNVRLYVLPSLGGYCTPQTVDGTDNGFYLDGVSLNAISNTGTGSQGGSDYTDYTTLATNLQRTKYYELTLEVNTDGNGGSVAAWIDFNSDSDFDDEGEKICQVSGEGSSFTVAVPVVVPNTAPLGIKRLRVRAGDFTNAVNACETIENGEAEDYTVNITQTQQVHNPVSNLTATLDGEAVELMWTVPANPGQAYFESFESGSWPADGWEVKNSTSLTGTLTDPVDISWEQTNDMDYVYNGNAAAYISADAPDFNWLISPEFLVYGDDAISFGIHYTSDASGYSKFYALIEVDGSWNTVVEYTEETTWANHYDEKVFVDMADYAGKVVRLAFVSQNNSAYPVAIDDAIVSSAANLTDSFNELTGYKVYRDGVLIGEVTDPSVVAFDDEVTVTENYTYCVKAMYGTSMSGSACTDLFYLAPLTPPVNLTGMVEGYDVHLQWSAPNAGIMRFNDDFESYNAGEQVAEQNSENWTTWTNNPGGPEDPYVTTDMAYSGSNAVVIEDLADLLWQLDEPMTEGHYSYNFKLYIPEGYNAYFNVLQEYEYSIGAEWGFQAFFDQDGQGYIDAGSQSAASFEYGYDVWMYVELDIDLDTDWAIFSIDGEFIHGYQWSSGIFGGGDLNQLQASDFYAWSVNGTPKYYIDDVNLLEVFDNENTLNYNVYRDGSMLGNVSETAYSDMDLEIGDYQYYVTAVYDEGESDPSNLLDITMVQAPYLPFFEDFEGFVSGEQVACQDPAIWTTWSNLPCDPVEDAYISDAQAYSGSNSVVIEDDNDLVLPFEQAYAEGTFKASFWMYIPEGRDAYWNVLQEFDGSNSTWGLEVFFDGGTGSLSVDNSATFEYDFDTWMRMELYVDLDGDGAQFFVDGESVHLWSWTNGGLSQFAAFDFYGMTGFYGDCEYYLDDLMIEEVEWTMPVLAPPVNLEADLADNDVHLTWTAPGGNLIELVQHDNTPDNGLYEAFDNGYGVVFDLSGYQDATIEMIDFRHSSWGITGTWSYKVHIVDWDTYTVLDEVGPMQTTVNDDWELEVPLGSVASSGGLVAILIEPMGNSAADAYPVLDFDAALDGASVFCPLSDMTDNTVNGGDFLLDLWIAGTEGKQLVEAKKIKVNGTNQAVTRNPSTTVYQGNEVVVNQAEKGMQDLIGYNVYRDGAVIGSTSEEMYDDTDLAVGQYEYYVTAVYDLGESDPSNTVVVDVITGIDQIGDQEVRIYPNPVSDIIYVETPAAIDRIILLNATGQVVLEQDVAEAGTITVNAGSLKSGIYYLRLESENGWLNKKIVKK